MALVGIIANPAASKDIRRLVAQGRVVPDWEKVNIVRRVLLGLEAVGARRVVAMPDGSHLVERARDDANISLDLEVLAMSAMYVEDDTVRAAALMQEMAVDCLVTLGGDGTNRAVAKGCVSIPLVAISTGTNNVFPAMIEGTLAGMVAGLVAHGKLDPESNSLVSKTLEVYVDGQYRDMALVDVALSRERFVATRAIWDINTIYQVFLTRAEPAAIGLSAVGARLAPISLADEGGLYYRLNGPEEMEPDAGGRIDGGSSVTVLAPIAPGMVPQVDIAAWGLLATGDRVPVERRRYTVALDGERAFSVTENQQLEIVLQRNGPPVVQMEAALRQAAALGLYTV